MGSPKSVIRALCIICCSGSLVGFIDGPQSGASAASCVWNVVGGEHLVKDVLMTGLASLMMGNVHQSVHSTNSCVGHSISSNLRALRGLCSLETNDLRLN